MPANLPPAYFEAEKRYREAKTAEEKIGALEEMLTIMPKHKGTDKLRADLVETDLPCIDVSTLTARNLHTIVEKLYGISEIIRVYTKAPGKEPDFSTPFILRKNSALEDLAGKIHKDFVKQLKFAKVWEKSVFDGRMVQKDHILQDGDIVEMHI